MKKTVFYFSILTIMSLFTISCGGSNDSKLIGKWKSNWDKFPDKEWYFYLEVEKNGDSYKLTEYDLINGSPNHDKETKICSFANNCFSGSDFCYDESKKAIMGKVHGGEGSTAVYYYREP